ncbi:murein biosynthesis integral membrane protein MurJ [Bdellovibrionota bacterium FG-2]
MSSPSFLRAAGAMSFATFLSRIMGLVREQVFAVMFGAGMATDAFIVAFRLPNLLRDLFAEGAMSAALVPSFTRAREEEGAERAWRLAGLVFRVLGVFVGILALVGIVFTPELVSIYAPAFKDISGKYELTVRMTRVIFPFFPLVALAAAFMGILNACGVFFLPAFASALFNIFSVLVGVAGAAILFKVGPSFGLHPIEGMALGVVVGGAVQAFCQLPSLYRAGYRWVAKQDDKYPVWYRDPRLRQMLWMMLPGTVGLAATQVNILVNTVLATSQGEGVVSWLSYAFRLMQFPIGVFGVSLASATLPRVSEQWVRKDVKSVVETLTRSLSYVFSVNLPASAGLAFLGFPIIQLIFQYGRFSVTATQGTAMALAMYAVGLTAYSTVKVLAPVCYALGNTRVPVISSILSVLLTVILNLMMVGPFGYWGLALGTSLAAIFNAVFLLVSVRGMIGRAGGELRLRAIFGSFFRNFCVALAMGVGCYFSNQVLLSWVPELAPGGAKLWVVLSRLFRVSLLIFEGGMLALVLAKVFGAKDSLEAFDFFWKKLKKRL